MICALSGQVATTPVVSPKSGAVFEKKLIETYISTAGKDPVSEDVLAVEELIPLRTENPAFSEVKPPVFNSIPTMLQAFQNEWDALALETFQLRKSLHAARDDLSASLYKYDAAVRVIARITRERDEAREALTLLSETLALAGRNGGDVAEKVEGETEDSGLASVVPALVLARESLFAFHKNTKFPLAVTRNSSVEVSRAEVLVDIPDTELYSLNSSASEAVVSGKSGTSLFNLSSQENTEILPETYHLLAFLAGAPLGVRGSEVELLKAARKFDLPDIKNIAVHPLEPYFVAVTKKAFYLCSEEGIVGSILVPSEIQASDLHVDGTLFAVSHGKTVEIYDITTQQKVSEIAATEEVTKLRFGFNGYWLVVASASLQDSKVEIYDLRKNTLLHCFSLPLGETDFVLDQSCQVLVTASGGNTQVHLYTKKGKSWRENVETVEGFLALLALVSTVEELQKDLELRVCGIQEGKVVQMRIKLA